MENPSRSVWLIPGAILVAGLVLAGTIFVVRVNSITVPDAPQPSAVTPVMPTDHLIGNPEAPVQIVEYSDIDSEFGKSFQATMQQLMTEYAAGGKVVWVYRHFPLTTVHAYALRHAVAAECTASLGTTESFWRFIDTLHAAAPGASEFNPKGYDDVVKQLGIDVPSFNTCLTSGKFSTLIRTQIHNALEAGATGAPYIVVLVKGQEPVTINGSISYDSMKKVIEKALSQGS